MPLDRCISCLWEMASWYHLFVNPITLASSGMMSTISCFCAAVSDSLVPRVVMALKETGHKKLAVAGGVAANSVIRRDILAAAEKLGVQVYLPPLSLCGDNAAMIGAQAYYEYLAGNTAGMELNAYATKSILGEAL